MTEISRRVVWEQRPKYPAPAQIPNQVERSENALKLAEMIGKDVIVNPISP
jgi:hypothetical protein